MSSAFLQLQDALLRNSDNWETHLARIDALLPTATPLEAARIRVARRLLFALSATGVHRASGADLAPLIRQVVRVYRQRLTLPPPLLARVETHLEASRLKPVRQSDGSIAVLADEWRPAWLDHADEIDNLEYRRIEPLALGDGMVKRVRGFPTYQSEQQKAAVLACAFAPPGSTTLVTLPTGAGKSLCAQLPAWMETKGGRDRGGTTIMVVPTIALAQDQERQARQLFTSNHHDESRPRAWLGETSAEERAVIQRGLLEGTLPLLTTSPEALMSHGLASTCEEAARRGTLNRLVIDEAHLIERWGAGFRTDFQLLAGFRLRLLTASKGTLRTLLLSATITDRGEDVLRRLFGDPDAFRVVRANRLRPEPGFWFAVSDTWWQRRDWVLEALRVAPRPAILYVTQPKLANAWERDLREAGYRRIGCFTGETVSEERQRLNRAWQADEIDVMVANSAFGLGVDKLDIRTIIHATLPETIDRYYQEVGRAGRDGCSAFGLLCLESGDVHVPTAMLSSAVVSTEKAIDRFLGMLRTAIPCDGLGNQWLFDMNAAPYGRPDMRPSDRSRDWNEHTLLLAQRAGVVRVIDSHPPEAANNQSEPQAWLRVEILDDAAVRATETQLRPRLEAARDSERAAISKTIVQVESLVRRYATGAADRCIATEFAAEYPDCVLACGGCPFCREVGIRPYADPSQVVLDGLPDTASDAASLHRLLRDWMGVDARLNVDWEGQRNEAELRRLAPTIVSLVRMGVRQVILPDRLAGDEEWAAALCASLASHLIDHQHLLVDERWVRDTRRRPMFRLPTLIVYPPDDDAADLLFQAVAARPELRTVPLLNVVHQQLQLRSLGGLFREKAPGLSLRLATLMSELP